MRMSYIVVRQMLLAEVGLIICKNQLYTRGLKVLWRMS